MIYTHANFEMFFIDLYEFYIELPQKSTPYFQVICTMFSGNPFKKGAYFFLEKFAFIT